MTKKEVDHTDVDFENPKIAPRELTNACANTAKRRDIRQAKTAGTWTQTNISSHVVTKSQQILYNQANEIRQVKQ